MKSPRAPNTTWTTADDALVVHHLELAFSEEHQFEGHVYEDIVVALSFLPNSGPPKNVAAIRNRIQHVRLFVLILASSLILILLLE